MFDVAEAAVTEDMTANANLCLILSFEMNPCHFEKLFEFACPVGNKANMRTICLSLVGFLRPKTVCL